MGECVYQRLASNEHLELRCQVSPRCAQTVTSYGRPHGLPSQLPATVPQPQPALHNQTMHSNNLQHYHIIPCGLSRLPASSETELFHCYHLTYRPAEDGHPLIAVFLSRVFSRHCLSVFLLRSRLPHMPFGGLLGNICNFSSLLCKPSL